MKSPARSAPANAPRPCAVIASCNASVCSAKACCRAKLACLSLEGPPLLGGLFLFLGDVISRRRAHRRRTQEQHHAGWADGHGLFHQIIGGDSDLVDRLFDLLLFALPE